MTGYIAKFSAGRMVLLFVFGLSAVVLMAQTKTVSILGDSYSTFEGFITPKSNYTWYNAAPDYKNTDVNSVRQTWWHRVITDNGWRLFVNNSFSGSTVCFRGYHGSDYRDRSFIARMDNLGLVCPSVSIVMMEYRKPIYTRSVPPWLTCWRILKTVIRIPRYISCSTTD